MSGFTKGGRDYLDLGTWNAFCAYCGRKRKARELVIDDEFARGLLVCREHRDLRHPQEFARGIKEDMTVPKVQPAIVSFVTLPVTFPLSVNPTSLTLQAAGTNLVTEGGAVPITTEGGVDIVIDGSIIYIGTIQAILPPWIILGPAGDPSVVEVVSIQWSFISGGAGMAIASPTSIITQITADAAAESGVLQVAITDSLGQVGTATANVHS